MNRRKSIEILGLGTLSLRDSTFLYGKSATDDFIKNFMIRWDNNRLYTFELFEAMPEESIGFQPGKDMMSFGKLFTHIGHGLDIYSGVLRGHEPGEEPDSNDKNKVVQYMGAGFNKFKAVLKNLDMQTLYTFNHPFNDREPWKEFTVFDIIILAYNHSVHHRAQATTYLRLKGFIPPKYRF